MKTRSRAMPRGCEYSDLIAETVPDQLVRTRRFERRCKRSVAGSPFGGNKAQPVRPKSKHCGNGNRELTFIALKINPPCSRSLRSAPMGGLASHPAKGTTSSGPQAWHAFRRKHGYPTSNPGANLSASPTWGVLWRDGSLRCALFPPKDTPRMRYLGSSQERLGRARLIGHLLFDQV